MTRIPKVGSKIISLVNRGIQGVSKNQRLIIYHIETDFFVTEHVDSAGRIKRPGWMKKDEGNSWKFAKKKIG